MKHVRQGEQKIPEWQAREEATQFMENIDVVKPLVPALADESKYTLKLEYNAKSFPELACYNNMIFQVEDNELFSPEFYKIVWEDVKLEKAGDSEFSLTMMVNDTSVKFPVSPVFGKEHYEEAREIFEIKFIEYQEFMNKRNNERASKNSIENDRKLQQLASNIFSSRIFDITNLGVNNCDIGRRYPEGSIVIRASYLDGTGNKFDYPKTLYYVDQRANILYTSRNKGIRFSPENTSVIWFLVDNKDLPQIAVARADYHGLTKSDKTYTFTMIRMSTASGITELRRLIGS